MSNEPEGLDQYLASQPATAAPQADEPAGLDEYLAPEIQQQKYGGLKGQFNAFMSGAGNAATLGAYTGFQRHVLGATEERLRGEREANPLSYGAGQVAGLVVPSLLGEEAGAIGAVGKGLGTAGKVITGAGELGAGAVKALAGEGLAARIGAKVVKSAIEGAVFQGGDEVSKMFLGNYDNQDPSQVRSTVGLNVASAGLIGGLFGLGLGVPSELWASRFGNKVAGSIEAGNGSVNGLPNIQHPTDLAPGLFDTRENLPWLEDASKRLGVELPDTMKLANKTAQNIGVETAKHPTPAGVRLNKQVGNFVSGLNDVGEKLHMDRAQVPVENVGSEIKDSLISRAEEESKAFNAEYEPYNKELEKMPISDDSKLAAMEKIESTKMNKLSPDSSIASRARRISKDIANLETVDQIKDYRTEIGKELSDIRSRVAPGSSKEMFEDTYSALTDMYEQAIRESGKSEEFINGLLDLNKRYADRMGVWEDLGVDTGLGNRMKSKAGIAQAFEKVDNAKMPQKFFDASESESLQRLKENFPEQFEMARSAKLREIYEKSLGNFKGSENKFLFDKWMGQLNNTKAITETARDMLYPGASQTIQDLKLLATHMPEGFNHSNTSAADVIRHMFTNPISAITQSLSDEGVAALIKGVPHFDRAATQAGASGKAAEISILKMAGNADKPVDPSAFKSMVDYIKQTIKGETLLGKATDAIFDSSMTVLPSHLIPDQSQRDKVDKKLKQYAENPNDLMDVGGNVSHYMPEHGAAMAETAANAVNYLNSLRPNEQAMNTLDTKPIANQVQKSDFERALDIAQQPLLTMVAIKNGTLTHKDVMHMDNLYPGLRQRTSQKLQNGLINAVHKGHNIPYKTRMGLSMYMGQPLDGTMTPVGIQSAQPRMPAQQPSQPSQGRSKGSMKSLGNIATAYQTPGQHRQASSLKH